MYLYLVVLLVDGMWPISRVASKGKSTINMTVDHQLYTNRITLELIDQRPKTLSGGQKRPFNRKLISESGRMVCIRIDFNMLHF